MSKSAKFAKLSPALLTAAATGLLDTGATCGTWGATCATWGVAPLVGAGAACSGLLTTCELAGRLMTLLGSTRAFSVEPGHVARDILEPDTCAHL